MSPNMELATRTPRESYRGKPIVYSWPMLTFYGKARTNVASAVVP
jgi:hypothetical protein